MSTSSADGLSAATVSLERSLLRVFFNRARTRWNWAAPSENPATDLVLAPINNNRDRVLSAVEEEALFEAMADCSNAFIPLATRLLLETAMRCSDLLHYAKSGQVDRESYMLHLNDAKTGKRDVPLSPLAVDGLIALRKAVPSEDDDPLMPLSYEALKASFERACARAGIKNLHLHDLRHTAATRLAKLSGSPFMVQQLTGHKSWASVMRYIHDKPVDALAYLPGAAPRQ